MAGQLASATSYVSMNNVTIDGTWTSSDEWGDAESIGLHLSGGYNTSDAAYFRIKHDNASVYVLVDFVTDRTVDPITSEPLPRSNPDSAWVVIDTNHDRGTELKKDDWAFEIFWTDTTEPRKVGLHKVVEGNWKFVGFVTDFAGASSNDSSNDPYSSDPHAIYEFKIPRGWFGKSPTIGLHVMVCDHSRKYFFMTWPESSWDDDPSTWGNLNFSSVPIPEFSYSSTAGIAIAVATVGVLARRLRPRDRTPRPHVARSRENKVRKLKL